MTEFEQMAEVLRRPGRAVGGEVVCLSQIGSTNDECRRLGEKGAPSGLAVLADEQTGGRGRLGRPFQSLAGKGLYLSVLLRPQGNWQGPGPLTGGAAVAVCRAVEQVTNLSCGVKWVNDVLLEGKKLCGILTELAVNDRGEPDFVIVGIGLNVSQTPADFGPDLSPIATSLGQHLPEAPDRAQLAAALLEELDRLWTGAGEGYLEEYRRRCLTVGRPVRLLRPQGETDAQALAVNPDFSLQVRLPDGRETAVTTGEVSVRGLLGYT